MPSPVRKLTKLSGGPSVSCHPWLQKIMDLSIQVHGELNSLYDMVFAFVECGKVHQARKLVEVLGKVVDQSDCGASLGNTKIADLVFADDAVIFAESLEVLVMALKGLHEEAKPLGLEVSWLKTKTPGLRAFNGKLDQKCRWLRDMGKTEEMANLVSVTKDIFDIDRDMMYSHLLKAYVQRNDTDKAIGVWTTMQEDDHQPSDNFLTELGEFLQASGREVPFAIPRPITITDHQPIPQVHHQPIPQVQQPPDVPQCPCFHSHRVVLRPQLLTLNVTTFDLPTLLTAAGLPPGGSMLSGRIVCIWAHDTHGSPAPPLMEESGDRLSINACSELVEGLITVGQLDKATEIALSMMAADTHPILRILKFLLLTLSSGGKVEQFQAFHKYIMNHNLKRRLNYDNLLCNAYVAAGRTEEVLEGLAKDIKDTPDTGLQELAYSFPRGGVMGILEKQPNYLPQGHNTTEQ
ncbi:Leucine-rich PPR motif-containing protein, mitochondrial [Chionoecetes opilio]|uniref:Leucine-rich PPR motif-containing protein, mitochondrial n=1 Tax=Chionoecetes opilio TaxID=41210 RepID=A0A8J4YP08_CHIOP|nr:Leucine-rich PPR motif-containing protein, mitochondrial [Chionoecetes opilio]